MLRSGLLLCYLDWFRFDSIRWCDRSTNKLPYSAVLVINTNNNLQLLKRSSSKKFFDYSIQSCKSGGAFRVEFGPKVDKNFELSRARDVFFALSAQKYN